METITIQGQVVLLPAGDYNALLNRVTGLERVVARLTQQLQDWEDLRFMRDAENDAERGGGRPFEDFIAELESGQFKE